MIQYHALLNRILAEGSIREDRTGTGTLSIFGAQMRFNLREAFPLVTTKRVHFHGILTELLWFLRGDTNTAFLHEHGVRIWDEWADDHGDLGPIYGKMWRSWPRTDGGTIDQIQSVIQLLKEDHSTRRAIVSAWNPELLEAQALPPCHTMFQFYANDGELSCQLYQRSADMFLGVPYNIASYALLTEMMALVLGLTPGDFVHTIGDAHIYQNHEQQVRLQLSRKPRGSPSVLLRSPVSHIDEFTHDHVSLLGYDPHPKIKAPIAV